MAVARFGLGGERLGRHGGAAASGRPGRGPGPETGAPGSRRDGRRDPAAPLRGRDFLTLADFTPAEVLALVSAAAAWKAAARRPRPAGRRPMRPLDGRCVGLLFLKPSTRTRVAFEVAAVRLGAHPVVLHGTEVQLARGETVSDTGRVLERLVDALVVRGHRHADLEELAASASIPVVNALTDRFHPSQALADLLTLQERFGRLRGLTVAYVGDGNNVAHSLALGAAKAGMRIRLATPADHAPEPAVVEAAARAAAETGGAVEVLTDPRQAVAGADAVYTDVWVSMGQEAEAAARRRAFRGYRVDEGLMALAAPHAVFLHCLPAHRGEEVEDAVMDGPRSLVFEQAENRLHAAVAILAALFGVPAPGS
jgi:ornithine carbamoyltransferase